jgi:polysaccharide deacetylase family protein (PEP-CTERM system associated)
MTSVYQSRIVPNALTVDVEDYFQVSGFADAVPASTWDAQPSRIVENTHRMLDLLQQAHVRATFFVLGWVAERFPRLVRRIAEAGHEVASHGYSHRLVYDLSPAEFRADLARAREVIAAACGVSVKGFRAPSFSITARSVWALDVLIDEGYTFDSSVFPIARDRYGIPGAPRHPHIINRAGGSIWEIPPSTIRWNGMNLPIGGGGYFRLLPYTWTRAGLRHLREAEERPAVFYLHPWELDPDQPRIAAGGISRFRHYVNLDRTEARLRRLLADFRFAPLSEVLTVPAPASVSTAPLHAPLVPAAARG